MSQAEVELAKGQTISQACRKLGVTGQTCYRWRKEYGGRRTDQALDMAILKEAAYPNC